MSPLATSGDVSAAALAELVTAAAALFPADGLVAGPADSQSEVNDLLPSDDALVLVAGVEGAPHRRLVAAVNPALFAAMGLADADGLADTLEPVLAALAGGQDRADARVGVGTIGLADVPPTGGDSVLIAAGLFLGAEHVATLGVAVAGGAGEVETPAEAPVAQEAEAPVAPEAVSSPEPEVAPTAAPAEPAPSTMDLPEVNSPRVAPSEAPRTGEGPRSLDLLRSVEMNVTAELGRTRMTVADLLSLTPGAVVELDRSAGTPIDVLVNGTLIARGEVVVIDEEFGVRISEIVDRVEGA